MGEQRRGLLRAIGAAAAAGRLNNCELNSAAGVGTIKLSSLGATMPVKPNLWVLGALLCIGVCSVASAQTVYKCAGRRSVTYTEQPCSKRTVNTDPAAAPVRPLEVRRMEENRMLARVMRPREGESAAQFETRRRRVLLMPADRAECGRLDTRIPVEEASLSHAEPAEAPKAEVALKQSRKRFSDLRC